MLKKKEWEDFLFRIREYSARYNYNPSFERPDSDH